MTSEDEPPRVPRAAACFGFLLAAISGMFSGFALVQWWGLAIYKRNAPPHAVEGGMAFAMNFPILAIEIVSYGFGLPALIGLAAVAFWKPAMLRSWFLVAGFICLLPTILLLLARFGINLIRI